MLAANVLTTEPIAVTNRTVRVFEIVSGINSNSNHGLHNLLANEMVTISSTISINDLVSKAEIF